MSLTAESSPLVAQSDTEIKTNYINVLPPNPELLGVHKFGPIDLGLQRDYSLEGNALLTTDPNEVIVAGTARSTSLKQSRSVGFLASVGKPLSTLNWSVIVPDMIGPQTADLLITSVLNIEQDYILVGSRENPESGTKSGYVSRVTRSGEILWARSLGDEVILDGEKVDITLSEGFVSLAPFEKDDRIVVAGPYRSTGNTAHDSGIYLATLTKDGTLDWDAINSVSGGTIDQVSIQQEVSGSDLSYVISASDSKSSPVRSFIIRTQPEGFALGAPHEIAEINTISASTNYIKILPRTLASGFQLVGVRTNQSTGVRELTVAGVNQLLQSLSFSDIYSEPGFDIEVTSADITSFDYYQRDTVIAIVGTAFDAPRTGLNDPFSFAYLTVIDPLDGRRISSSLIAPSSVGRFRDVKFAPNGDIIAIGSAGTDMLIARTDGSGSI